MNLLAVNVLKILLLAGSIDVRRNLRPMIENLLHTRQHSSCIFKNFT